MADLTDITLLSPHRVRGLLQATDAQCTIHKGVADDLIKRGIAKLTNEPTDDRQHDDDDGE